MTVVILVAGSGRRFMDTKPKSLCMVNEKTLLERTIGMVRNEGKHIKIRIITGFNAPEIEDVVEKIGDEGIETIYNKRFNEDQNILSAQIGMTEAESDVLVLEGDCIYNEESMKSFISMIGRNRNTIFTIGEPDYNAENAILKRDSNGKLIGYKIGKRDPPLSLDNWSNMAGAVLFSQSDLPSILSWLDRTKEDPAKTYYFQPLVDMDEFEVDLYSLGENAEFSTFNTQKQYLEIMDSMGVETKIKLIETDSLKHVEGFSQKRVSWLKEKILDEGVWNKPICIDSEHMIVMDGQHRMEVAKELGMKFTPCVCFKHEEVDFWSLRPKSHEVNLELVMSKALSGDIYPYKTVKYSFPTDVPACAITLGELM